MAEKDGSLKIVTHKNHGSVHNNVGIHKKMKPGSWKRERRNRDETNHFSREPTRAMGMADAAPYDESFDGFPF